MDDAMRRQQTEITTTCILELTVYLLLHTSG